MADKKEQEHEESRRNAADEEMRYIRVLYIINAVLSSPLIPRSLMLFLRCFYIQYIVFAILTIHYIYMLKEEKPSEREYVIFCILVIIHVICSFATEFLFKAAMGI